MTLLKDRINELITGYIKEHGKFNGADLARTCKLGRASISEWKNGETKSIQGKYIFCVSKYFSNNERNLNPDWLSTGKKPKWIALTGGQSLDIYADVKVFGRSLELMDGVIKKNNMDIDYDIRAETVKDIYKAMLDGEIDEKQVMLFLIQALNK